MLSDARAPLALGGRPGYNAPMERRVVSFRGRVQGVGFRATCAQLARRFEISGWVRNETDGSVRLEAQGDAGELDAFVHAVLDEMGDVIAGHDSEHAEPDAGERGFEIRR